VDRPLPRSRLSGLRLALVALLLFAMQPLLHAHAMGRLPDGHVGGVHAPGADFANAAVGEEAPAAGPVVVSDAHRVDDPVLARAVAAPVAPAAEARHGLPADRPPPPASAPRRACAPRGPPA
jgi:hypothetical protein